MPFAVRLPSAVTGRPDTRTPCGKGRRRKPAYAPSVDRSPLPSGRDTYRTLADHEAELAALADTNPGVVQRFEMPEKTIEGRTVYGIEITRDVAARDGKPVSCSWACTTPGSGRQASTP